MCELGVSWIRKEGGLWLGTGLRIRFRVSVCLLGLRFILCCDRKLNIFGWSQGIKGGNWDIYRPRISRPAQLLSSSMGRHLAEKEAGRWMDGSPINHSSLFILFPLLARYMHLVNNISSDRINPTHRTSKGRLAWWRGKLFFFERGNQILNKRMHAEHSSWHLRYRQICLRGPFAAQN